ncbi:hypothetical protein PG985_005659 [Apiospora marii]|uniref:uncharacterized protein n=1 Tax=Apiospora marii TaxID=335849 RepID=UPI00312E4AD2
MPSSSKLEESSRNLSASTMLNLRKLPLVLAHPLSSKQSIEELHADPAMAKVTNSDSSSPLNQPVKNSSQTSVVEVPQNGSSPVQNGQQQHVEMRSTSSQQHVVTTRRNSTVRVYEEALKVRKRVFRDVHDVDDKHFDCVNLESYLAFIADERLIHMPKKGSRWDCVLQEAEFFGILIDEFSTTVTGLVPENSFVRDTALGGCQMLLELGCDQADALEPTFNVLYEFGHLLGHLIQLHDLFTGNDTIVQSISSLYASLVRLIGDDVVTYRQRISRLSRNTVTIDFDKEFSSQIPDIWSLRSRLFEHMWSHALRDENVCSTLTSLQRQLVPSTSEYRPQLYGRIAEKAERAGGTCEWVEGDLTDFLESGEDLLAITGSPGCGKSVLSAWLRERLQKPIHVGRDKLKFETFGFAFANDNPEGSTTLAFLKSMASQLLAINVGDAKLLQKLTSVMAYWDSKGAAGSLETGLWSAVEMGLSTINSRDVHTVIIVDALGEIADGDAKASVFSEKLHGIVNKLSLARVVGMKRTGHEQLRQDGMKTGFSYVFNPSRLCFQPRPTFVLNKSYEVY